jgi:hypothetical protein
VEHSFRQSPQRAFVHAWLLGAYLFLFCRSLSLQVRAGTVAIDSVVSPAGFIAGFVASFSMILVSEFGDRTFFIVAILAMNNNRMEGPSRPSDRAAD